MSVITTSSLGSGFPVANGVFDLERSPGNALARSLAPIDLGGDDVRFAPPYANSILRPPEAAPGWMPPSNAFSSGGVGGSLGSIIQALMGELASLFQQLARAVGFASADAGGTPGPGISGQRAFDDATASSTGDPHESFDGMRRDGPHVAGKWDSMTAHHNLLSSDSFDGGFRVSNTVTAPTTNGVTTNARIGVATDGGRTTVGMNADGSYDVVSFGRHVDLVQGKAVRLGENESVTLNADRSLTIDEANARGGSIATTLRSTGGGVDVSSVAHHVDLGGYLVSKNDVDGDPVAFAGREAIFAGGSESFGSASLPQSRPPQRVGYAADFAPDEA